jgi:SHAQKYF class myb-like DNA-binding protein
VPEGALEAVSAEDAMEHCGRVLGFEYGAANCAARGRELLGLSGVPEGALDAVSAEDAMAHTGRVLGFGNLDKTFNMKQETAEKRGRFFWSPQLSKSFNAAVEELGGVKVATAKSILERMLAAQSTPALTRTVVNSRLHEARKKAKKQAGEI